MLAEHRGVRNLAALPPLSVPQILGWADAHKQGAGEWPTRESGAVPAAEGETWGAVDAALSNGGRGFPGGSSLARVLAEHRGVRNPKGLPELSVEQILSWADQFAARAGRWPQKTDGPIPGPADETWGAVDDALRSGARGLPSDSSLARLLAEYRNARNHLGLSPYTTEQILDWADAHFRRFGAWPTSGSGPVADAPGETWLAVQHALAGGGRGLPGGSSLAGLLAERRGRPNHMALPPLGVGQILAWADAHHRRTGAWPNCYSGPVEGAQGETWRKVHNALYAGQRGLPGGSSLARLLAEHRNARYLRALPGLSVRQILDWADEHVRRTGSWPRHTSGAVGVAPGETWAAVEAALRRGLRGLPGGSSLFRLLKHHCPKPDQSPPRRERDATDRAG